MAETHKQMLMRKLKISSDEADALMKYDKQVDKAKATETLEHDLPPDKAEAAKKFIKAGTKNPTVYKFDKPRERKQNATKGGIIAELYKFLTENSENAVENAEITNKERQIAFSVGENRYELTLIQKRKPK